MQNQNNDPKIVIVGENEAYTGDQVAIRFIGAEMKEAKIAAEAGSVARLEMAWSVSLCVVHIPGRYKWISFDKIFQYGTRRSMIAPNYLTEGDTIIIPMFTYGLMEIGMIEEASLSIYFRSHTS